MGQKEMTGRPAVLKEVNIGLIRDALQRMGQATRVELCRETGISQPTINVLIRELTEKEIVCSLGTGDSIGGRRAEIYALNWKRNHCITITVDGSGFAYCVFDLAFEREAEGTFPKQNEMTYTGQLTQLLETLLEQTEGVTAVAVGVPGAVSVDGQVFAIPQIPEWEQFELKSYLEERFEIDIAVVNDINAVAAGYYKAAQDTGSSVRELAYLHVGEKGLGAGILIDGKLHCGCNSFAGEVGYMQVSEESMESQLARAGEEQRMILLARVIANMICVLDPQQIVLGGRVTAVMAEQMENWCRKVLPLKQMPMFTLITDSGDYYFEGLATLGWEVADHSIRLQQ